MDIDPFKPLYTYRITVHRVVDGDTIEATIDLGFGVLLKNRKIRLAGINAPELKDNRGTEAKDYLSKLIYGHGRRSADAASDDVTLLVVTILDKNDKYGRILGRLFGYDRSVGSQLIDLNAEMVANGFATVAK